MDNLIEKISLIDVPDNTQLEIECRYFIDGRKQDSFRTKTYSPEITKSYVEKLIKKYDKYEHKINQSINFMVDGSIKQMTFINGEQQKQLVTHYKKTKLINPLILVHNILPACKFAVSYETKVPEFTVVNATMARIRLRYTISLPNWQLDITLVKSITDFSNVQILKNAKAAMLFAISPETFIEKAPWSIVDTIEFELEYTGKLAAFNIDKLAIINELFDGIISNTVDDYNATADTSVNAHTGVNKLLNGKYQELIYQIAKIIRPKDSYKFKNAEGLKQLSNQVIELDKNMFLKDLAHRITDYYITDKVDGKRTILYIADKSYAINDELQPVAITRPELTVFDGEFYENNYYAFDLLIYNGNPIVDKPFEERFKLMQSAIDKIDSSNKIIKLKPFIRLTDEFQKQIAAFKTSKKPYETDGLVLTPYNETYIDMTVYKYKPIERLTVDFLIKKCPDNLLGIKPYEKQDGKVLYLLFSGISSTVFKQLRMTLIRNYEDIFPSIDVRNLPKYIPVQFQPSDLTFAYLYYADVKYNNTLDNNKQNNTLDNVVGEFGYDVKNSKWVLHNIRKDRQIEVERGNYFGNNYKVAEMTWLSYETPLVIEKLDMNKELGYFQEHDNQLQKASRNFNSFVKSKIFEQIAKSEWVMDMASGKGQDLFRYAANDIRHLVCLEIDAVALQELIYRKHQFSNVNKHNTRYNQRTEYPMEVLTKRLDLNVDYTENIELLNTINIQQASMNVIMCNFALHYLIADKKHITNILKFVSYWLMVGGQFIFTTFDAKDIIKLLNENKGNWTITDGNNVKYSIKKQYQTTLLEKCGQQIEVLLPFSKNNYYTEYLLNIDYIAEEAKKVGLELEINQSFSVHLEDYKVQNRAGFDLMDDNDKIYSSLYHVYNFTKKTSGGKYRNKVPE